MFSLAFLCTLLLAPHIQPPANGSAAAGVYDIYFNDDMTVSQNTLPLLQTDVAQFGKHIPAFDYWLQRDRMDAGVKQGAYRDEIGKIDLPVLHISSWLDGTAGRLPGRQGAHARLRHRARPLPQFLRRAITAGAEQDLRLRYRHVADRNCRPVRPSVARRRPLHPLP
jgi:hypothetical protein